MMSFFARTRTTRVSAHAERSALVQELDTLTERVRTSLSRLEHAPALELARLTSASVRTNLCALPLASLRARVQDLREQAHKLELVDHLLDLAPAYLESLRARGADLAEVAHQASLLDHNHLTHLGEAELLTKLTYLESFCTGPVPGSALEPSVTQA